MKVSSRVLLVTAVVGLGLSGALVSAGSSHAQMLGGSAEWRIAGDEPASHPAGSVEIGAVRPDSQIRLDVILKIPDPGELSDFIADVSSRQSPLFHRYLRPGQFGSRFGPAVAAVAAVRGALRQAGLSPGPVAPDRLSIPVIAPAAAVERAFGTALVRFRLPGGQVVFTNSSAPAIAAAAAPYVGGILGLSNVYVVHSMTARPVPVAPHRGGLSAGQPVRSPDTAGPRPCSGARAEGAKTGTFTANELASHYLMSPLYGLGDFGRGVRVALFELEPNRTSDIRSFESCYGVHTPVRYHKVDSGSPGPAYGAGGEAALDIENIAALAPGVSVDVYRGPPSNTGIYDTYQAIVQADHDQVISTSWGGCEADAPGSLVTAEQSLFKQAASQGQTVFASAGDSGSTGCDVPGDANPSVLSADDPATQPYVIAVGGTSVSGSADTTWNDSAIDGGAGGGGRSVYWCMPAYQYKPRIPGLISSLSEQNSSCPAAQGKYVREEPDVSADANPETGYVIYWNDSWNAIGGTSAAAPLWAAIAALTDASPFCAAYKSGDPGLQPAGLYAMFSQDISYIRSPSVPEVFYDVTRGSNDYTPSGYTGKLFPATAGYDMASGLGAPLVSGLDGHGNASMFYPGLAAVMCQWYATRSTSTKVASIRPRTGPLRGGQHVTVTGSGLLPITGADMAEVGSKRVPATCVSDTKCTIVMPRHAAGTVAIRISAEDLKFSAMSAADRYQYRSAPKIRSLSPLPWPRSMARSPAG
jgi:subtilase family serine protease